MIRAHIPISRNADGLWKVGPSFVQVSPEQRLPIPATSPNETVEEVLETVMGETLLCLDKNGRRGTSEPIEWEILVDHIPYCYWCVEPMRETSQQPTVMSGADGRLWQCAHCERTIQLRGPS